MIIAANLKCNHTRASFKEYANVLSSTLSNMSTGADVMVFAPASAFYEGALSFSQGAQNFYPALNGSFTGEIGADMLDEFGINTVLIGHSERRALGESDEFLRAKFEFAKARGWRVVYCVGESESVYKSGKSVKFIKAQAQNIDLNYQNLIIAYEPIFSIGTGVSATSEHIASVLAGLKSITDKPLLYGGSVSEKNAHDIVIIPNCSGVLVGTASWQVQRFIELILACLNTKKPI